jgi:C1A family cysteine protease
MTRRYSWIPDHPDQRDHVFIRPTRGEALPKLVDLRPTAPPVRDQGELGSCTGHGVRALLAFNARKANPSIDFAPLYIYYEERKIEGTVKYDSGAMIRDGVKACAKVGACEESLWPYDIARFKVKPTAAANSNAAKHKISEYQRVATLDDMRAALAAGHPVVIGFSVYESFESAAVAKTGVMPMPKKSERLLGGHCVAVFGYDDSKKVVICQNSWGTDWGVSGFFFMPYGYITNTNLSDDFWIIKA